MKKKISGLIEKQGFILFLFICVCLVAGGTLYLSMKNLNTARENTNRDEIVEKEEVRESSSQGDYPDLEVQSDMELGFYNSEDDDLYQESSEEDNTSEDTDEREDIEGIEGEEIQVIEEVQKVEKEEKEEKTEAVEEVWEEVNEEESIQVSANNTEPEVEEDDSDFVEVVAKSFMPVEGEVITEYTKDVLVYSDTLESWVGHGGIDIKASEGSPVKSILPGRVKEVYEDKLWGIVIVIDHGNGLETKYANLETDQMVEKDVKVEKGDHISKIGKTAKIEMHLEPHLHFEVRKDGKLIDPRSIID